MSTPNAWFPKLSRVNAVLSGNAGIWHTAGGTSVQLSPVGTTPCWAGLAPVWNMNDGTTQFNFGQLIPTAYNAYNGSDDGRWAGSTNSGNGRVDVYTNATRATQIEHATCPRFGGPWFAYLTPFQSTDRELIANGGRVTTGKLTNICLSPGGEVFVYQTATGTYTRAIWSLDGKDISVRNNEDPVAAFLGPWGSSLVTVTPDSGVLIRPAGGPENYMGYRRWEILNNLDARMVGPNLRIVGASNTGQLTEVLINFSEPRTDLRKP